MPAQQQITNLAVQAAPDDYTLGANVEFDLIAVNAEFVDNGAGGDWLPAVVLVSDSDHVIARAVDQGVKVTAGDDAEVSWFPWLTNAGASTPTTGTRLPWCLAEGNLPTNSGLPSYFFLDTKDTSLYQLDAGSSHVQIIGAGLFRVTVSASIETAAFAATTVLNLDCAFTATHGINYLQNVGSSGWPSVGLTPGGTPIWNAWQQFVVSNNAGNVHTLRAQLSSNPPGVDNADHYVFIERIDDDFGGPL